ncbi:MAG: hypothetical protein KAH12_07530, partial [Anaerolineales bacterium]|nr:hypothetical protein [Anaerolineales bacterium]
MLDVKSGTSGYPTSNIQHPDPEGVIQTGPGQRPGYHNKGTQMNNAFNHESYLVRKKILTLAGAKFHIYDPQGKLVFFSKMKAFKLKEDIRLFTDEDMQTELLNIQARNIIDIAATYDVSDPESGDKVGALRRKGLKSILKDEWAILDVNDNEIGLIKEDSMFLALLRRFLTNLIPQTYLGE